MNSQCAYQFTVIQNSSGGTLTNIYLVKRVLQRSEPVLEVIRSKIEQEFTRQNERKAEIDENWLSSLQVRYLFCVSIVV